MLTSADKFWIALLFLGANVIRTRFGIDIGLNDELAADLVQGAGALLVWLIPNKAAKP